MKSAVNSRVDSNFINLEPVEIDLEISQKMVNCSPEFDAHIKV